MIPIKPVEPQPECCNQGCRQGRDCPVRLGTHKPVEALIEIKEPTSSEE